VKIPSSDGIADGTHDGVKKQRDSYFRSEMNMRYVYIVPYSDVKVMLLPLNWLLPFRR